MALRKRQRSEEDEVVIDIPTTLQNEKKRHGEYARVIKILAK